MSVDSLPQVHREIGGHHYTCTKMAFRPARQLLLDLKNEFGEGCVRLFSQALNDPNTSPERMLASALMVFASQQSNVAESIRLMDAIMATVTVDGEVKALHDGATLDRHFGDVDGMARYVQVFQWAMETQYSTFFGAPLSRLFQAAQTTSTGTTKGSPGSM